MTTTEHTTTDPRAALLAGLPVSERRVTVAGVSTAVLEGGDGPPLVLLHGPGAFAAHGGTVLPELAGDHRVIAPDLPGHGAVGAPDGRWTPSACSTGSASWSSTPARRRRCGRAGVRRRDRRPVRRRPARGRCARLVLVDSARPGPVRARAAARARRSALPRRPQTAATYDRFMEFCAFDLDGSASMGPRWAPYAAYASSWPAPERAGRRWAVVRAFGDAPIPPAELARIDVPTILIWGRHDLATRCGSPKAAGVRYGWPLHVIESAGDDPPLEQPDAFLAALRAALGTPIGEVSPRHDRDRRRRRRRRAAGLGPNRDC